MFKMNRLVGASDIGAGGRMRIGAVVDLIQDCSGFQVDSMAAVQEYFKAENVGFYMVSRQIDIKKLPVYGQLVTVGTVPYECKSFYGFRNTCIFDESGEVLVAHYCVGAFVNLATARPVKVPAEITAIFVSSEEKQDMEYTSRKVSVPADAAATDAGQIAVRRYHLDQNLHVNNARYADIAEEFLPEKWLNRYNRLRIDYRAPAKPNTVLTAKLIEISNGVVIDLLTDGVSQAALEFTEVTL